MYEKHTEEIAEDYQPKIEGSRRAFLKKAGKFAIYTPPVVMLLTNPSYACLKKSYCGRPYGKRYGRNSQ
jgi:hypothetical protein